MNTSTNHTAPSTMPVDLQIDRSIATTKYIALVRDIGRGLSYAPGWRGEAARRLGISHSLLSQILQHGRRVTRGSLEKAIISLKLPGDYFGSTEEIRAVPSTMPPPPPSPGLVVDPLLLLEGYRALPEDTRKRLLHLMQTIE